MTKQDNYGSIPAADEETALITREGGGINGEEDLDVAPQQPKRKYGKGILMTLVAVAVFAVLAFSDVSPVSAMAKSSGGGGAAPGAPPFDWKAYGANIKKFWADQKAQWAAKKAEMKANNATAAEAKEAKSGFWNSTMPDFSDVLNTTKAAERQRKEAETKANDAAIKEAMAEVEAQRSKGSK